ncbi:Oidioi.mRNA.OKI2018_I69.PAR.g10808.t1.cds [Oikopleura dioica]|uniref:Oidioi.mRNA.OKI2018_I69.PAR.g10808.t1.cds n=1 Tax=Oikopleura dioica TaxID=34765 RepID=A0ABN7RXQ4_OIKDI|nr:Oidioi.mRNA.OKI2018_I69.PAR.g10808.t1.cds [Oikopleura dioica]
MNGRHLPVWLKPENEHRITRQRLRSLGPVSDLSKPLGYSEDVSQSLQSLVHGTPIAAVQPLRNTHGSKSQGELQSHRYVPTRTDSPNLEFGDSETASLPDSTARHDFEVFQPTRQAWTPAAQRRNISTALPQQPLYGSLQSFDSFIFTPHSQDHSSALTRKNLRYHQRQSLPESKPNKRKKTFLSQSRDRLDVLVGKLSSSKKDEDYRSAQQRRRREGTLSPRSTEYSLMIQRATHVKPGSESGYEPGQSSASDISTIGKNDKRFLARRRWFAHHDAQSTAFEFEPMKNLFDRMNRRSYIATGASAAVFNSALESEVGSEDELQKLANSLVSDAGDGKSNKLVVSCPQFRNEIGTEKEVVLPNVRPEPMQRGEYRQVLDTGRTATVFEGLGKPVNGFLLEGQDHGQKYYSKYFLEKPHSNYIGEDERYGPVSISIRREKREEIARKEKSINLYRIIIRTASLYVLRGSILEELIPLGRNSSQVSQRDCLMHILPELDISVLRRCSEDAKDLLQKLDEKAEQEHIKVGVLLCKRGQSSEEEMYNNTNSEYLDDFMGVLANKVRLKGFTGFRAGLDVRDDSTGMYSYHTTHRETQIMFHVSTLLPFSSQNSQQVDRKRHIGNDVISIIFQEPGAKPFSPATIRSQFQHIFIIVRAVPTVSGGLNYQISVSKAKCVPDFGPAVPADATFRRDSVLRDFLLTKIINGRNVIPKVGKFANLAIDMRRKFLRNILENCSLDAHGIENSSNRFSIFKRSEKRRARVPAEIESRGGVIWKVESLVPAHGANARLYTFNLVLSHEQMALVLPQNGNGSDPGIFENTVPGTAVFSIYPKALLGWTLYGDKDLVIFYGTGDFIQFSLKNKNDRSDLITRLDFVSRGVHGLYPPASATRTIVINRKQPGMQLGFHISYEGFVNQVDEGSAAHDAGLQKGSRIVQINSSMLANLSHNDMIECLRSLPQVVLCLLPPSRLTGQSRYTPRDVWTLVPRLPNIQPEDAPLEEPEEHFTDDDDSPNVLENIYDMVKSDDTAHTSHTGDSSTESDVDRFELQNTHIMSGETLPYQAAAMHKETFRDKVEDIVRRQSPKIFERRRRSMDYSANFQSSQPDLTSTPLQTSVKSTEKDQLTASALLGLSEKTFSKQNLDSHNQSSKFPTPRNKIIKSPRNSSPSPAQKSTLPRHLASIRNIRDNPVVFCNFKNGSMHYPPSKRRPGRDQSNPRQTDSNKLQQDLLNLITEPLRPAESQRTLENSRGESTDDELSPRKFNHEHLTEADRQFSEFHQNPSYTRRGRSPAKRPAKSSTNGADDLARQVEELRVRLDEEQSRNQQLESEVTTLRQANLALNSTTSNSTPKPRKIDYV